MGEKVKFIVSLTVVTTVATVIGSLFIAVYLPVIKRRFRWRLKKLRTTKGENHEKQKRPKN